MCYVADDEELEACVTEEMDSHISLWEEKLQELHEEIGVLQEQLEQSGINLAAIYHRLEEKTVDDATTK
eukprot:2131041-Pyramimonas_sp.AAC.1